MSSNPIRFFRKMCGREYKPTRRITERHFGIPADDREISQLDTFPKIPKDETTQELIMETIKSNEFLKTIVNADRLKLIVDAMYLKEFATNDFIIKEGELGSHLYVSMDGVFEVSKNGVCLKRFQSREVFGELAILYNCKRNATVQAKSKAEVWVLDRATFQSIIHVTNFRELQENVQFLSNVPGLQELNSTQLIELNDLFENEFFPTGTEIIRQGDFGDQFYVIRAGQVTIKKRITMDSSGEMDIAMGVLSRGGFFGELALTTENCRQATVIAQVPGVHCLTLSRNSFQVYLANSEQIKNKNYYKTPKTAKHEDDYTHVRFSDLVKVGSLGVGGFGHVELVQYRKDRSISLALKRMVKQNIQTLKQREHVFNEKHVLSSCNSIFICRFYKTYKDNKYLYFLMEACLGGDIWTLLSKQEVLEEAPAKFISACVIEALDYLHSKNIIFRDLKCENIVLDYKGYAKLCDFGSAKRLLEEKTYTMCVTEYLAPEVILGKGHNRAVDIWSLGNLINEILSGNQLFAGQTHTETYKNILGVNKMRFGNRVPKNAQNLIKKLCCTTPATRLGYQAGWDAVRNHRWFDGFHWAQLQDGKLTAPLIKPIKGPTDLSNFDCPFDPTAVPQDDYTDWDKDF